MVAELECTVTKIGNIFLLVLFALFDTEIVYFDIDSMSLLKE